MPLSILLMILGLGALALPPLAGSQDAPSAVPSAEIERPDGSPPAAPDATAALVTEPDDVEAHELLGMERLRSSDYPGAVDEFREAMRLDPSRIGSRLGLGKAYYLLGDFENALEAFRSALRLDPESAIAHLHLATVLLARRDWAGARDELETVRRLQPDSIHALYTLGHVRYAMGDRVGAETAYRDVITVKPDHADAHYNLGLLLKLSGQDAVAAEEFYVAALAGLPRAQYFLGSAHAAGRGVERNLAVAVQWWYRAADQQDAQAKDALSQLRQSVFAKGKRPEESRLIADAFAAYRTDLRKQYLNGAADSAQLIGDVLLESGRIDDGLDLLIREAEALSEPAQQRLETLYLNGIEGRLPPHHSRILEYLKAVADEGAPTARLVLARIYATGTGVPQDVVKARSLLKNNPLDEAKSLLNTLTVAEQSAGKMKSPPNSRSGSPPRR